MISPLNYTDFYKTDHRRQYPSGTSLVYSNITARGSRIPGINSVVVFGAQYFIKDYLLRRFNEGFFKQPKSKVVAAYKRRMDTSLGKDAISVSHIEALHDLGYLPIEIKCLEEGTLCPMRVPFLTIKNTLPEFFWVTNFLETIMCNVIWGAMTSATTAHEYKKILTTYANKTSDMPDFVNWQGHDFSMRGMFGLEAALISGSGHLLSFTGTDTVPAIDFLEHFYAADAETELIGGSVPATEHSVMCLGGLETELDTYKRLITEVYPTGIVSIVSDTWDYWATLRNLSKLRNEIMSRDGKLVVRPDSGDPVDIICGYEDIFDNNDESKGSIQVLWEMFGGTVNSKGYKQLDPHIGLIYGDSITLDRCKEICHRLERKGFASTNIVLGIGSYTYQHVTRDTFGFAMKSTYGVINDVPVEIFKAPKTDSGIKNSAKGLLRVNADMSLSECVTAAEEEEGMLKRIFLNGIPYNQTSLKQIRAKLKNQIAEYPEPKAAFDS